MSVTTIILLCAIACPVSMGAMMLFMRKGHHGSKGEGERENGEVDDGNAE
jgi:hypothetical protein